MDDNNPPVRTQLNLPEVDVSDDTSTLSYTQKLRTSLINGCAPQGIVPTDPEIMKIMLKAADGMDKVALTRLKIKSDEKVADTQAQAAGVIADMLLQQTSAIAAFGADSVSRQPPPSMGAEFVRPHTVPGEMDISPGIQSVSGFMQSNRPDLRAGGGPSVLTPVAGT